MHFRVNKFEIFLGKRAPPLATPAYKNVTLNQIIVASRILPSSYLKDLIVLEYAPERIHICGAVHDIPPGCQCIP